MRSIYSSAFNGVESVIVPATGSSVDSARQQIVDAIKAARDHRDLLVNMGCIHAHIHFKADGKTMFMNRPSDETGKRGYIHVGVNPEKQKEARDKVHREDKRRKLTCAVDSISSRAAELDRKLDNLLWEYGRLIKDAQEFKEVIKQPNEYLEEEED
ncbi:hypothetical protein [Metapseudomonas furukawaii]|uniref:hypothetical protein n=1 Tax=Metapseudomonas furukawaii TaxID=1149133 RepID=UPI00103C90A1|nr:hypothetical protein [Pseudomonas furukawaii]